LIEEFMLLANIAVATKLHEVFPAVSVLRKHPNPKFKSLTKLQEILYKLGFEFDLSSNKSL